MKNRFILILVITSLVLGIMPCSSCFAETPSVAREYIARKIDGKVSNEEKVIVNYTNLRTEQEEYIKISFFDGTNSLIDICEMDLTSGKLENVISLNSESLKGTQYIIVEFIGPSVVQNRTKIPLKI